MTKKIKSKRVAHYHGMLVSLPDSSGVGKLDAIQGDFCTVSVFRSTLHSETLQLPLHDLKRAYLSPQTRVYVLEDDRFRVGRVTDFLTDDSGLVTYEVRFPNNHQGDYAETALFLRPWSAPEDPAEALVYGYAETQFLHDHRQAAIQPLLRLRSAAQGLTALMSAGIELAPHQVSAVRRVLTDPIQRYLLADEVGLGKTIEAGLIIRQHLIDNPDTTALIAVPSNLVEQWRNELSTKLHLDQFDTLVEVITHAQLAKVTHITDILVIDEAHHLVGVDGGALSSAAASLNALAAKAPVLLLLSATPALGDEVRFLALLNLLDPASHPLEDVAGFREKLKTRREIGRLLLALDSKAPKLVLRQRGAELQRLFPDDPYIATQAPRLVAATRDAPDDLPDLCDALKTHVADSYRIHQRLIRSRRADAQGWEFTDRGPVNGTEPSFKHVRVEADEQRWADTLMPTIEEWRVAAIDAADGDGDQLDAAARRYAGLISATSEGREMLSAWIAEAVHRPAFADEPEILKQLVALIAEGIGDDGIATALESTRRLMINLRREGSNAKKVVAFATSSGVARRFADALGQSLEGCEILSLVSPTEDHDDYDHTALEQFTTTGNSAVLICDSNGEEGLNIACADAIVHLDLPLSAARIEQRIGRLDRFGRRNGIIRHRIVLPSDEDDSPWSGWFDFLAHGLQIFHRSISDVQFLLEECEQRLFRVLLEQGPAAVAKLAVEIRSTIHDERRSQDEQYALDRIALAEEPVESLLDAIDEAEADEGALERGVDHWLIRALGLRKHPVNRHHRDPFTLSATQYTLIPRLPWLSGLKLESYHALTWRRRIATNHPDAVLLRPGMPLIDGVERFTRWDDRGTAFITWRTIPEWEGEQWVGFRLCFVVEPNITLSNHFSPNRSESAAIRRAQRFLPPRTHVIHVDFNGEHVTDAALLAILQLPYRAQSAGPGRWLDLNLASRPAILNDVLDPTLFARQCRAIRDTARQRILSDPELADAIATGVRAVTLEVERRRARLQRRHAIGDAFAYADIEAFEAILPAIAEPAIRLDAMGCFIISSQPPSRGEE